MTPPADGAAPLADAGGPPLLTDAGGPPPLADTGGPSLLAGEDSAGEDGAGKGPALDGNAMAGDLREIFAVDVTSARFMCAGCAHTGAIATLALWHQAPGLVARCPNCADVVIRVVRAPGRVYLDLRGSVRLEVPLEGS